ncbi:Carbonic anhydrase, alpha-class [Parasponia andersonii]|uniref:Carbonic anhydrase n=1 Tax=Parasponia andersonii TaxID=3476 RepID=A0A2P5BJN9_PARAD|nr:Carbonic anhydrase, alpha-class [Parasponia andersonii]
MKYQNKPIYFLLSVIIFSYSFLSTSVIAQEVEDEREFDYARGGEKGPQRWGELKKEWAACKNGEMQSPIDLSDQRVRIIPKLGKVTRSYRTSNATLKNRGHDISLQWDIGKAGSIKINGTEYFLQQCHWHSPSEHTINGRRYDMEMHMVHISTDEKVKNKIAVVGVLYKLGRPDSLLSKLMRHIAAMADNEEEKHLGMTDPTKIKLRSKKYYRYMGSLTVPPCTEGVIWTISKKLRTVSREQVKQLRVSVHDYAEENARPVQPLNRRGVHLIDGLNTQDRN